MKKIILSICALALLSTACGGRLPKPTTSKKIIQHHFKKYGKKYKDSPFGKARVKETEILETEEIHKHFATTTAFVTLENSEVFKVRFTLEKTPFGWRYVLWENLH